MVGVAENMMEKKTERGWPLQNRTDSNITDLWDCGYSEHQTFTASRPSPLSNCVSHKLLAGKFCCASSADGPAANITERASLNIGSRKPTIKIHCCFTHKTNLLWIIIRFSKTWSVWHEWLTLLTTLLKSWFITRKHKTMRKCPALFASHSCKFLLKHSERSLEISSDI